MKRKRRYERIRKIATTVAVLVALAAIAVNAEAVTRIPHRCTAKPATRLCAIHFHVTRANHYRSKMGKRAFRYGWMAEGHPGKRDRILTYWTRTQRHTMRKYHRWRRAQIIAARTPWSASWYNGAICVHEHEGAWNSNTGNGYYGGMQFDSGSWLANGGGAYASRADLASPHDQLLVAYHYWRSSGWNPWPNTARMCGLL